jgi:hypothetical protein
MIVREIGPVSSRIALTIMETPASVRDLLGPGPP